jgi:hypothetical protein
LLLDDVNVGNEPIDIYGPEGIRDFIRSVIQLSYSKVVAPHRIHELKEVPYLHGRCMKVPAKPLVRTRYDSNYGEKEGSSDIYPEPDGTYKLFHGGGMKVMAAVKLIYVMLNGKIIILFRYLASATFHTVRKLCDGRGHQIRIP